MLANSPSFLAFLIRPFLDERQLDIFPATREKPTRENNVIRKEGERQNRAQHVHKKGRKERAAKSLSFHFQEGYF
jgi:hypothetical protein